MVGAKGLEPSWVSPLAPKASAYTSFATRPLFFVIPDLIRNLDRNRKKILFAVLFWILKQVQDDRRGCLDPSTRFARSG